jgi:hypothetical protein
VHFGFGAYIETIMGRRANWRNMDVRPSPRNSYIYNPKIYARWLFCIVFCIVLLLPAVTLVAIATGLIMTN